MKKFPASTEVSFLVMQIMGGIGYTDIFPIERMLRDFRLSQIWTETRS